MKSKVSGAAMTPLHIEVAQYYFKSHDYSTEPYTGSDADTTARIPRELLDADLLEAIGNNRHYKATAILRSYIKSLSNAPLSAKESDISQLDTKQSEGGKYIGMETVGTRNSKIAALMEEYKSMAPKSKM
jgi:hypothetical protein